MTSDARESIVRRALGADFEKLHPELRKRHAFASADGVYSVGTGVMDRIWTGSIIFRPFLLIGSMRNIMFPESGENVPFRIECWAYRDRFDRETISLNRSYGLRRARRFDEYVVDVPDSPSLIIYVGSHQHLAVDIAVSSSERGGIEFRTGRQRLMLGPFRLPFPLFASAEAVVHEWYDEEAAEFRIDGRVRNRLFGDVFGAVGRFQASVEAIPAEGVPARIRPVREEARW
ncbi:MAG: DUF4166 domain-containing protein [bacterium]|nr:DUF4166 domain-containing protein [bacterium]